MRRHPDRVEAIGVHNVKVSTEAHTTPVGFVDAGGRLAVAAANGGSDDNPDWFRNIENDAQVTRSEPLRDGSRQY